MTNIYNGAVKVEEDLSKTKSKLQVVKDTMLTIGTTLCNRHVVES